MKDLETTRLVVRPFALDDAPFILRLLNEPSFVRFIGDRRVRTLDDARRYLVEGPLDSYTRLGFGLYAVISKEEQTVIGMCGLLRRDALEDVDVGFAFLSEYCGRGYAFESAMAVMDHGRDVLGLGRIVAVTATDNQRSIAVLEKLGLRFERWIKLAKGEQACRLFVPPGRPASGP